MTADHLLEHGKCCVFSIVFESSLNFCVSIQNINLRDELHPRAVTKEAQMQYADMENVISPETASLSCRMLATERLLEDCRDRIVRLEQEARSPSINLQNVRKDIDSLANKFEVLVLSVGNQATFIQIVKYCGCFIFGLVICATFQTTGYIPSS